MFEKLVGKRFASLDALEQVMTRLCGKKVHCIESESELVDNLDYMIDFEIEGSGDVYTLWYLKGRGACRYYITEVQKVVANNTSLESGVRDVNDFRVVLLKDCVESDCVYGIIMLSNKHSVEEFQKAIGRIKNKFDNNDWLVEDILTDEELNQFDWFMVDFDENHLEV